MGFEPDFSVAAPATGPAGRVETTPAALELFSSG
jgi:hypothetical protein